MSSRIVQETTIVVSDSLGKDKGCPDSLGNNKDVSDSLGNDKGCLG